MTRVLILAATLVGLAGGALAQTPDTSRTARLSEAVVEGVRLMPAAHLPDRHEGFLMAGKKSQVLPVGSSVANLADKTGRQVFAKVPGAFVYDMDGAGNQINVSTRGLDPHRSWELNVRHNGVVTNSDLYGYPASHFSPPLESIDRVELVHGTGSLQYGSQFGGMVNYVTKEADTTRAFSLESINTAGSFGQLSTYNAVGGQTGGLRYYAYVHRRGASGYRTDARTRSGAEFASLSYDASRRLSLRLEWAHSAYRYQQPGPLTDSLFAADPRQATRSRNHYEPDIHVPSVALRYQFAPTTQLRLTASGLLGTRSSVQWLSTALVPDTLNRATGQYRPRQVDIDTFRSLTTELRLVHDYAIAGRRATVAGGMQVLNNRMRRRQLGVGSTGTDFDLRITGDWGRNLTFATQNVALFAESVVYVTSRLGLTAGARYERGASDLTGTIRYLPDEAVPNRIPHRFPLFGGSAQYRLPNGTRWYAGVAQAYRPLILKDLIAANALERVDDNLRDNRGFTAEAGTSGRWRQWLSYDVSGFQIAYRNRLGGLFQQDAATGQSYVLRTNLGDTRTRGVEALVEATLLRRGSWSVSAFTSTAYFDARYTRGTVNAGGVNQSLVGNRVESVPRWTSRNGLELAGPTLQAQVQVSYVGDTFADALNTVVPTRNGARGLVPGYGLLDLLASVRVTQNVRVRGTLNNALDRSYFTKRPTFYPEPGLWPSDGRSVNLTLDVAL